MLILSKRGMRWMKIRNRRTMKRLANQNQVLVTDWWLTSFTFGTNQKSTRRNQWGLLIMSSVLISLTAYLLFSIRRYEFAEIDRISTLRLAKLIILPHSLNKRNWCPNSQSLDAITTRSESLDMVSESAEILLPVYFLQRKHAFWTCKNTTRIKSSFY